MGRFTQGMSGPAAIDALNAMDDEFTAGGGAGSGTTDNDSITNQQAVKALTGTSGLTIGDILYASGANIMSRLQAAAVGNVLISNGAGVAPSYGKVNLNNALHVSGILPAGNGGTGKNSYAQYSLLYAPTTSTVGEIVAGAAKTVLTGTGAAPTFAVLDMTFMPTTWVKHRVKCASTAALTVTATAQTLTNSGTLAALTLDGITPALNEYVLIKDQASAAQNGIYELTTLGTASVAWVLTRPAFADSASDMAAAMVAVSSGTTLGGETYTTKFKSTDTIGTTNMVWSTIGSGGGGGGGAGSFTTLDASGATTLASTLDVNDDVNLAKNGWDGTSETYVTIGKASNQNCIRLYGRNSGSPATIEANGFDTNINIRISAKTAGAIEFRTRTGAALQAQVSDTVSAVNYVNMTGAATGAHPVVSALGSDTNIDLRAIGKGTGGLSTNKLKVTEGSNATMGTATLVGGSITVSTTAVTANSRIFLTNQSAGGTVGFLRVSARSVGASFTVASSSGSDTSTIAWMIVEPA